MSLSRMDIGPANPSSVCNSVLQPIDTPRIHPRHSPALFTRKPSSSPSIPVPPLSLNKTQANLRFTPFVHQVHTEPSVVIAANPSTSLSPPSSVLPLNLLSTPVRRPRSTQKPRPHPRVLPPAITPKFVITISSSATERRAPETTCVGALVLMGH